MDDDKDNMLYNLFFLMFNLVRIITYMKHKKKIVLIKNKICINMAVKSSYSNISNKLYKL